MSDDTLKLDDSNFNETIGGETPVLVDFWAEWCGPCHLISPILSEMATEYKEKITIAKLNVDENPGISGTYDVMGIPTLILFKEGVEKKRIVGARPKHAIVAELTEYLQ